MITNTALLDKAFQAIMSSMVNSGRAPDYDGLAVELGLNQDDARIVLRDVFSTGHPGWLDEHDTIVTFCPFSNVPNQYRLSVDGEHQWYGQ